MKNIEFEHDLKDGLTGILRLKNEARFISDCIDSCIGALDELVVVYNDCTDETPEIVEQKRKQYPDKIRVYPYPYHILSYNLTKEEFDYAMSLSEDSPQLFCSLCNFALSKIRYKYAVIIDPDQLYFADELKKWRDVCAKRNLERSADMLLGWFFMMYFSLYRRISFYCGKPIVWMLPDWLVTLCRSSYFNLAAWRLKHGKAVVALSGFNVFKDDRWYIPFDGVNIHPPYNGEGDHLIFSAKNDTYFYRRPVEHIKRFTYGVSHLFHCPLKPMFAGPVWFHLHANREYCWDKVKKMKDEHPEQFVPIEDFQSMTYRQVLDKMDKKAHTLFQMTLFALVHKMGKNLVLKYIKLLNK